MSLPLCVRIDAADNRSAAALSRDGWRWIENLLTYHAEPRHWTAPEAEHVHIAYRDAIVDLVGRSFTHDRLHADPKVARGTADAEKRRWAYDSLEKHQCFVKVIDGQLAGFVSLILGTGSPRVDLICVDSDFQGRGIAKALLQGALAHYSPCGLTAGTQESNTAARRLYEGLGMWIGKKQCTFHK